MKLYRIMDDSKKDINALLKGEIEVVNVKVQGFKGLIAVKRDNLIKSINTNSSEFVFEKPAFIVCGKQEFNDIDSFDLVNATNEKLRYSKDNNCDIECKFNDMKALYNVRTRVCKVVFEGLLYVA